MLTGKQTIARGAVLAVAVLATGALAAGVRSGMPSHTSADASSDPVPCVAAVLPGDAYYQAIAEMNACTGSAVPIDVGAVDPSRPIRVVFPAQP